MLCSPLFVPHLCTANGIRYFTPTSIDDPDVFAMADRLDPNHDDPYIDREYFVAPAESRTIHDSDAEYQANQLRDLITRIDVHCELLRARAINPGRATPSTSRRDYPPWDPS